MPAAPGVRSTRETPPCSWTKPQCGRRRHHPTVAADESRGDNGEATPAPPSKAATEADITIPELPEILKALAITDRFKNLKHLSYLRWRIWSNLQWLYDFLWLVFLMHVLPWRPSSYVLQMVSDCTKSIYLIVGKSNKIPWQSSRLEIPGIRYGGLENLRKATITGFCTAESLIELTWHILERASSLQCLVLDATPGYDRKSSSSDRCLPMPMRAQARRDAENILTCVRKNVEPKVPIGVEIKFLGPCSRCHTMDTKGVEEERRFLLL